MYIKLLNTNCMSVGEGHIFIIKDAFVSVFWHVWNCVMSLAERDQKSFMEQSICQGSCLVMGHLTAVNGQDWHENSQHRTYFS